MIPKIVHYAWFGSEVPETVEKRVDNWKKKLPDWNFKLWNEDNFDLSQFPFSYKMYKEKKLGYVADELRYYVVNKYGGFYFDTDIVIKKNLDIFLNKKMVLGFQYDNSVLTAFFGSEPNSKLLEYILKVYRGNALSYLQNDLDKMTSNPIVTKILLSYYSDFCTNGKFQELEKDICIYPKDYFAYLSKNSNANYAEHVFDNSWGNKNQGLRKIIKMIYKEMFPYKFAEISAKRGIQSAIRDGVPYMNKNRE